MAECGKIQFTNVVCVRKAFLMGLEKLSPSTVKKQGARPLPFLQFLKTELFFCHKHTLVFAVDSAMCSSWWVFLHALGTSLLFKAAVME